MKDLLPHYEVELALLRRLCRGFAGRYPGIAGNLQMSGDTCQDPHVERLIQASALLAARISKRLDDDYPLFTESMLQMLYPHYLRSFPSCSIVHIDFRDAPKEMPAIVSVVPRGTIMKSDAVRGTKCKFSTTSDIVLAPARLAEVRFCPIINAPTATHLPPGVTSCLEIHISSAGRPDLSTLQLPRLRLFIDAEPTMTAALRDTLLMRVAGAYLSFSGETSWNEIRSPLISAVGFAEEEALIPFAPRSHPAYRLLTEYFTFPEKFQFVDIDWSQIAKLMPQKCRGFTLHLAIRGAQNGSHLAQTLAPVSAKNLLLNCAAVVNLFPRSASPVNVRHTTSDYALVADTACPEAYEIYDIASARLITDVAKRDGIQDVKPFYSLRHGEQQDAPGHYWTLRRDDTTAELSPGHEMRISVVDANKAPLATAIQTLSVDLICTNRDLPASLGCGRPNGDLTLDGLLTQTPVRLLRRPTNTHRFESGDGAHWRLISHLTLNHRSLSGVGLDEFREMLVLYNLPRDNAVQRQIQGVTDLRHKTIMAWMPGVPSASLMPGVQVRLTIDEEAFVGHGIHLFAQTIDHFFGLHGQINVFSQLVVVSQQTGEELLTCAPRSGQMLLA